MSASRFTWRACFALAVGLVMTATHAAPGDDAGAAVANSTLDAPLFYQLLIGELELRAGEAGTAYQVELDAARRTNSEQLFQRATEIALQARAGEQALAAVTAWRQAWPQSPVALRYQVQLLVALNRMGEAQEPLVAMLALAPPEGRSALIDALPGLLTRQGQSNADRAAAAMLVERLVQPYLEAPQTRTSARVAAGRAWLAAGEPAKTLALVERAASDDPSASPPVLLALELLPATPAAEAVVTRHLAAANPGDVGVRLLYVRTLAAAQRTGDAVAQVRTLTQTHPELTPPWLSLGALELELHHPAEATAALKTYVRLVEAGGPVLAGTPAAAAAADDDDDDTPASPNQALTQAWLLLAQAAEEQKDFKSAEAWLARIDNPQRALDVQQRRASLLARQGRVAEARELIRRVPEQGPGDARAKVLAESALLRDRKLWAEADKLLVQAIQASPDDTDLLYERAMIVEKLGRLDEMERLLRRVIVLKPDHHHAYNALGYSLAERGLRLPEARQLIQKALELSPGEPFITDSLGWVEFRLGNRDEALRLLRGAYQSRPDTEIAAHLGEVLWSTGRSEEARRVWREGRTKDATNDVLRETLIRLRVTL